MLAKRKDQLEDMLFDYQTTNKTDYRFGQIEQHIPTIYEKKDSSKPRPPRVHKDLQSMRECKAPVSFNLMIKPKPIVQEKPDEFMLAQPPLEPMDEDLEEAQRHRPRVVMTPAVSLDDITDKQKRQLLIKDIYKSSQAKVQEQAVAEFKYKSVRAPIPETPSFANPITLEVLRPPMVPLQWRVESMKWDREQLRGYCDPTKEFWLRQEPSPCRPCQESAIVVRRNKCNYLSRNH